MLNDNIILIRTENKENKWLSLYSLITLSQVRWLNEIKQNQGS